MWTVFTGAPITIQTVNKVHTDVFTFLVLMQTHVNLIHVISQAEKQKGLIYSFDTFLQMDSQKQRYSWLQERMLKCLSLSFLYCLTFVLIETTLYHLTAGVNQCTTHMQYSYTESIQKM